jgi:hypothetical protein
VGGKSSGSGHTATLVNYYLSVHYGICAGPVDALRSIRLGDMSVVAWPPSPTGFSFGSGGIFSFVLSGLPAPSGIFSFVLPSGYTGTPVPAITSNQSMQIINPQLFGGISKEGGVCGFMDVMLGGPDQLITSALASRLALTPTTAPGFRGVASLFFHNATIGSFNNLPDGSQGFYWSCNNPFLKGVWAEVTRIGAEWYPETAPIYRSSPLARNPSLTVASGLTGNTVIKWDTNNDVVARFEGGITAWSLPTGAVLYDNQSLNLVGGHITSDGQYVLQEGGGTFFDGNCVIWIYNSDFTVNSAININSWFGRSFSTIADDITVGGTHYMMCCESFPFAGDNAIGLLVQSGGTWSLLDHADNPGGSAAEITQLSMGMAYAYGQIADATKIKRIAFPGLTIVDVTPPGLTDAIKMCHYDQVNNIVLILCVNGDLFSFTPDLSTMLNSNTGLGITPSGEDFSWKRPYTRPGHIGVVTHPTFDTIVYEFAVPSLQLSEIIDPGSYPAWAGGTTYNTGQFVNDGTAAYYSLIDNNTGNTPSATPAAWFKCYIDYSSSWSDILWNPKWGAGWFPTQFSDSDLWFLPIGAIPDMNPAHIIHEALTNIDWGMSAPVYALDDAAFRLAADTLYSEDFGLSLMFTQQATIEDFLKEILDHIEGVLYVDPQTGLIVLKLVRGDYVLGDLPVFDETNCIIHSFARKTWGDTTNEVVVSWTNPETEASETITVQDLGNISIQGGIVSDSRNYYGVRTSALATKLALRDLRTASQPLATAEIEANRAGWNLTPGGVLKLTSVEYGIASMAMRIGNIDYGKPDDAKIKITLIEDIFSKPTFTITDIAPVTAHVTSDEDPKPAAFAVAYTLPYIVTTVVEGVGGFTDPEVLAGIFVAQTGSDTLTYDLYSPQTSTFGGTSQQLAGTNVILSHATLTNPWVAEASSTKTIADFTALTKSQDGGPVVGGYMMIDGGYMMGGTEDTLEICGISALTAGNYTILRGLLDTTPKAWTAGSSVWFFTSLEKFWDSALRSVGESVTYNALTRTSTGVLPLSSAPNIDVTLSDRPYLPTRPANVKVDGDGWGPVNGTVSPSTWAVTWAERNRLTEDAVVLSWTDGDVSPEAGQTTTITVLYKPHPATVINVINGLTGSSHTLDYTTDLHSASEGVILKFTSKRDGLESLQGHTIEIDLPLTSDEDYAPWVAATGG